MPDPRKIQPSDDSGHGMLHFGLMSCTCRTGSKCHRIAGNAAQNVIAATSMMQLQKNSLVLMLHCGIMRSRTDRVQSCKCPGRTSKTRARNLLPLCAGLKSQSNRWWPGGSLSGHNLFWRARGSWVWPRLRPVNALAPYAALTGLLPRFWCALYVRGMHAVCTPGTAGFARQGKGKQGFQLSVAGLCRFRVSSVAPDAAQRRPAPVHRPPA